MRPIRPENPPPALPTRFRQRWRPAALLLTGLIVPYAVLNGRALVGDVVLLPLDLLALPDYYLPRTDQYAHVLPQDQNLLDLIEFYPFNREFAANELRNGRLPLWDAQNFCGAPFCWTIFCPFEFPYHLFPNPRTLAWMQLLQNLVFGVGVYSFARRCLRTSFWPATVGAWCAPWTGFVVLWQGYPLTGPVVMLPWLLLAVDKAVRAPLTRGPLWLAVAAALTVLSGALDIAGQVFLVAAMYALWALFDAYGRPRRMPPLFVAAGATLTATVLGIGLTSPWLLHFLEHTATGSRMARRGAGAEERPPGGLGALPQIAFPEFYGRNIQGSLRISRYDGGQLESAAGAYSGAAAALFLAPVAIFRRAHRRQSLFWCLVAVIGLGWCLNLPGLVPLLRLPVLNMFSHNRFTFATSLAVLSLAILGLEAIQLGEVPARRVAPLAILALSVLALWHLWHWIAPPEPLSTKLEMAVRQGKSVYWIHDLAGVSQVRDHFARYYEGCIALCCGIATAWGCVYFRQCSKPWFLVLLSLAWLAELLCFADSHRRQSDPRLYYPRIGALERIRGCPPGRILGVQCLPPKLNQSHHLPDVRGYDAVDPARIVELLELARAPGSNSPEYAQTQWFAPMVYQDNKTGEIRFPPVLDLLGVRYLIFRQPPPEGSRVLTHDDDYWVVENVHALPRAFVPEHVTTVGDPRDILSRIGRRGFHARQNAYVEESLDLMAPGRGDVGIVEENPCRVELRAKMATAGLVVLADSWHSGWRATIDDQSAAVLRVNTALRGVVVPAGHHTIVFTYQPQSFRLGLALAALTVVGLAIWWWLTSRAATPAPGAPSRGTH